MAEPLTRAALERAHPWRPIPGCPGRYVLPREAPRTALDELVRPHLSEARRSTAARDPCVLLPFADGGGLLTWVRADGGMVHTLADPEGWLRKHRQLGFEDPRP